MANLNVPVVNAPNLYVDGLPLIQSNVNTITVDLGRARNASNVSDLKTDIQTVIRLSVQGVNGVDILPLTANRFYAIYLIGDSTGNNPAACILSLNANTPLLPSGYDMFRRIGWTKTDALSNNLVFFEYGDGLSRTYYYSEPVNVLTNGAATTFNAGIVDLTTPFAIPPFNTISPSSPEVEVILDYTYTPAAAANTAQFAVLNGATVPIIRVGAGVAAAQVGTVRIPTVSGINPSGGISFRYRVSAGDTLTLLVAGFTDVLSNLRA